MDHKKVTVQDIADALGLSRNTVSKVLNGTGGVSPKTRESILRKAMEMNYKQYALLTDSKRTTHGGNIALFTHNMPNKSHFGFLLLSGFEQKISEEGYTISTHILRENDLSSLSLPVNFDPKNADGILCIELFDKPYSRMICDLGLPTLFADAFQDLWQAPLSADCILMENRSSTYVMVHKLIEANVKSFGFVGDRNHCCSFHERWEGFRQALLDHGLSPRLDTCILENDSDLYSSATWMLEKLKALPQLPEVFVCANDFIAISLMRALKMLHLHIPEDILICGFDDSPESGIIEPKLTTVHIFSHEMGSLAAQMLLDRIGNPSLAYHTCYVRTEPKFRRSTGGIA